MAKKNVEESLDNLSYNQAISQIEEILRKVEEDELDVDELAAWAKKANELIQICKVKLRTAEKEIENVFVKKEIE